MVVAIIVVLVAIAGFAIYGAIHKNDVAKSTTEEQAYQQLQKVETKPSAADDKGGILISSEGYGKKVSGAPTVAVYMDPLCPGCGEFNRQTDPTLISLVDAGQINLEIHPMSFMDEYSTDEYSSRATGAILYIASNDDNPDHLLKFISNIYAEDFQPGEASEYKSVKNKALKQQAIDAGVPQSVADKAFNGEYKKWLDAINLYTPKRPELWQVSGSNKGVMSADHHHQRQLLGSQPAVTRRHEQQDRHHRVAGPEGRRSRPEGHDAVDRRIGQADLADDRRMTNDPSCPRK